MLWFFPLNSISHLLLWYPITLGLQPLRLTASEVGGRLDLCCSAAADSTIEMNYWLSPFQAIAPWEIRTTLQMAQLILLWIFCVFLPKWLTTSMTILLICSLCPPQKYWLVWDSDFPIIWAPIYICWDWYWTGITGETGGGVGRRGDWRITLGNGLG